MSYQILEPLVSVALGFSLTCLIFGQVLFFLLPLADMTVLWAARGFILQQEQPHQTCAK